MSATTQTRCFCQSFEFGNYGADGSAESYTSYTTECSESTGRVFAQGHDAKLAGFLVRAEMAGDEISIVEGGMRVSTDAVRMALKVSEAFASKVAAMLDAAKARVAKKAAKAAGKVARKSAERVLAEAAKVVIPEPIVLAPIEARIKVGRWTYDARIDRETRVASFTTKLGQAKTAAEGTYSVL